MCPVLQTVSHTLNLTTVDIPLLQFNAEINADLEFNYTGKILRDMGGGSLESLPLSCYFHTTSVNQLSFHLALQEAAQKSEFFCSSLQGYPFSSSA